MCLLFLFFLILCPSFYLSWWRCRKHWRFYVSPKHWWGTLTGPPWSRPTRGNVRHLRGSGALLRAWTPYFNISRRKSMNSKSVKCPTGVTTSILKCLMLFKQGLSVVTFFSRIFMEQWKTGVVKPALHLRPGRISFSSDYRKQSLILQHLIMTLMQSCDKSCTVQKDKMPWYM